MLSSQVACLNHLFLLRIKKPLALAVLQNLDPMITDVGLIDGGYVGFEVNGKINYFNERTHKRGANSTSIDAVMIGVRNDGKAVLYAIEWKYTESYPVEDKLKGKPGKTRHGYYHKHIKDPDSPISHRPIEDLFFEPFYQMMRQTLLAWKITENHEYDVVDWMHNDVIPEGNQKLMQKITSPGFKKLGNNLGIVWKACLKYPDKYRIITPDFLLQPLNNSTDTDALKLIDYLKNRYW
jgi:hypothetical protein